MSSATPVLLLHVGRSGSTVLGGMLGRHPAVQWEAECLLADARDAEGQRLGRTDPLEDLARRCEAAGVAGKKFVLVSAKPHHFSRSDIPLQRLLEVFPDTRCAVLRRRNLLRKVVSNLVAQATGRWHRGAGDPEPRVTRMRVDVAAPPLEKPQRTLVEYLDWYAGSLRLLSDVAEECSPHAVLHLTYERDVDAGPAIARDKILKWLELPGDSQALVPELARTTPWALREVVENWDEVVAALAGTPYEWMVHE